MVAGRNTNFFEVVTLSIVLFFSFSRTTGKDYNIIVRYFKYIRSINFAEHFYKHFIRQIALALSTYLKYFSFEKHNVLYLVDGISLFDIILDQLKSNKFCVRSLLHVLKSIFVVKQFLPVCKKIEAINAVCTITSRCYFDGVGFSNALILCNSNLVGRRNHHLEVLTTFCSGFILEVYLKSYYFTHSGSKTFHLFDTMHYVGWRIFQSLF